MKENETILEQLAEFTAGIDCGRLPENVKRKIVLCIMDALECCLSGSAGDPRLGAVWRYVRQRGGGASAYARGRKLTCGDAVFYNTVAGAISSRNDISKSGSCHPGSIVVPVVLALAEENGNSGGQVMEAVLSGYETMIRLGIALRASAMPGAFRSTAVLAPFGAAFAAAKLLGLSREQTVSAASFACHSAGGLNNWVSEGTGEDVLQNGWGARNGLEAALLAATGLPAAKSALEDRDGLLAAFSATGQQSFITDELGEKWHILDVDFKPMSSCLKLMAPCQIARKLLREVTDIRKIREIRIGVAEKTLHHAGTARVDVESQVQAIMSIPFGVANVLVFGDYRDIKWYPPYDERVLELTKRCRVEADPWLTGIFPAKRGARVALVMEEGGVAELLQEDVEGLEAADIEALFGSTMEKFYGPGQARELKAILTAFAEQERLDRMFEILGKGVLSDDTQKQ